MFTYISGWGDVNEGVENLSLPLPAKILVGVLPTCPSCQETIQPHLRSIYAEVTLLLANMLLTTMLVLLLYKITYNIQNINNILIPIIITSD